MPRRLVAYATLLLKYWLGYTDFSRRPTDEEMESLKFYTVRPHAYVHCFIQTVRRHHREMLQ